MSGPVTRHVGGCRCGGLRFEVRGAPLLTFACHCAGCQRMTGSAFSLSAAFPSDRFAVTNGEPVIGGLHGATRHYFCPHCLSWVYSRPEGADGRVNVRATLLDEPVWSAPFIEVWTSEGLPWAKTPAVHSYETKPEMEAFEGLVAGFAERSGRGAA